MIPTIIALGPIAIHSFGLMLVLSLVAGWRTLYLVLESAGEDPHIAEPMIFWAGVGGVVGARIAYLLSFPAEVAADPWGTIFGGAGFVFYGGLILGTLAVYAVLRRHDRPFLYYSDLSSPALCFGYAVGRIGCHLSGDGDYGSASTLPWAVSYANGVVPTAPGVLVHPTPVYETLIALGIGWFLLRLVQQGKQGVGGVFGRYLILSALARFFVEILRIEPVIAYGLTEAQWISLALVVLGLALLFRSGLKSVDAVG